MDIVWVHIAVERLKDVRGMCMHHSVCTTVNIYYSHTFLLSQTECHNPAWKLKENIFHKKFGTHSITLTKCVLSYKNIAM